MRGFFVFVGLISACSVNKINSEVIERSDELSERPAWVKLDKSFTMKDGQMMFVGFAETEGLRVSKSALLNVSDEKALSEPMRSLVSEFLDQNQVGEGLNVDLVSQRVLSATRGWRPAMPSLHVSNRYYETSVFYIPDGSFKYEVKAFSLVSVSYEDFERAKRQMNAKLQGNSEVQEILKEVGTEQRTKAMSNQ